MSFKNVLKQFTGSIIIVAYFIDILYRYKSNGQKYKKQSDGKKIKSVLHKTNLAITGTAHIIWIYNYHVMN